MYPASLTQNITRLLEAGLPQEGAGVADEQFQTGFVADVNLDERIPDVLE